MASSRAQKHRMSWQTARQQRAVLLGEDSFGNSFTLEVALRMMDSGGLRNLYCGKFRSAATKIGFSRSSLVSYIR